MFRLWCSNRNEWESDQWAILPNGDIVELYSLRVMSKETHTLLTFSGFYDIDSRPIYEGDIFDDGSYCIKLEGRFFKIWLTKDKDGNNYYEDIFPNNEEVVGNIFENEELLEKECRD